MKLLLWILTSLAIGWNLGLYAGITYWTTHAPHCKAVSLGLVLMALLVAFIRYHQVLKENRLLKEKYGALERHERPPTKP